jgi:hypothetical protein
LEEGVDSPAIECRQIALCNSELENEEKYEIEHQFWQSGIRS